MGNTVLCSKCKGAGYLEKPTKKDKNHVELCKHCNGEGFKILKY